MKVKKHNLLSGSADLTNHKRDKIEFLNMPDVLRNCKSILIDINRLFYESEQHQINKEYQFSIISLRQAFEITYQLKDSVEEECAKLFRITIIKSLENITKELRSMKNGLFSRSRYNKSYNLAEKTLSEFNDVLQMGNQRKVHYPVPSVQEKMEHPIA